MAIFIRDEQHPYSNLLHNFADLHLILQNSSLSTGEYEKLLVAVSKKIEESKFQDQLRFIRKTLEASGEATTYSSEYCFEDIRNELQKFISSMQIVQIKHTKIHADHIPSSLAHLYKECHLDVKVEYRIPFRLHYEIHYTSELSEQENGSIFPVYYYIRAIYIPNGLDMEFPEISMSSQGPISEVAVNTTELARRLRFQSLFNSPVLLESVFSQIFTVFNEFFSVKEEITWS
jgi:hypothetical protein